ncbi:hypothetical protein KC993_06475, partial [Proteus mirabilis]
LLCSAPGAWINLVQALCQYRKRKAPENIQYINRGGLKHRQFDSASILIGVQEEMKKYSLIGLIMVAMITPSNLLLEQKPVVYSPLIRSI